MGFPRVPYKTITGSLRLAVRPATVEVTAPEEPVSDFGPDESSTLSFKLPKGFSLDESPQSVVTSQIKRAQAQSAEVRAKRRKCGACKNATSLQMLDLSDNTLLVVEHMLISAGIAAKIQFSQERDGSLVTYCEVPGKTLAVKIMSRTVEVGYFIPGGIAVEKEFTLLTFAQIDHAKWLVEGIR